MKVFKTVLVIGLCAMISNINAGSSYSNVVDLYGHKLNITYDQQLSHLSFYKYDQREITNKLSFFRNANLKTSIYMASSKPIAKAMLLKSKLKIIMDLSITLFFMKLFLNWLKTSYCRH